MVSSEVETDRARGTDDLEKLLALAENLQEKYEASSKKIETYRLFQGTLAVTATVTLGIFIAASLTDKWRIPDDFIFMSVALSAVTIVYIVGLEYLVRRLRRRSYPDRRALQGLLELIRETEGPLAQSKGWSALDRAQFQIRLSRLEIAP